MRCPPGPATYACEKGAHKPDVTTIFEDPAATTAPAVRHRARHRQAGFIDSNLFVVGALNPDAVNQPHAKHASVLQGGSVPHTARIDDFSCEQRTRRDMQSPSQSTSSAPFRAEKITDAAHANINLIRRGGPPCKN